MCTLFQYLRSTKSTATNFLNTYISKTRKYKNMDTSLTEASWCYNRFIIYMAPNNNMHMAKRGLITVLKFLERRYKE